RHAAAAAEASRDRAALAEARAAADTLSRDAAARQRRLAAIADEQKLWHERGANGQKQILALEARRGDVSEELLKLAEAPDELEIRLRALNGEIAAAEAARREADDRLAEAETKQRELDRAAN